MKCLAEVAAVAALGAVVLLTVPVAAEPATAGAFQLGAGFRYGFDFEEGDLNPWGTGLGIDLGYTAESAVFFGGNFEYFFGTTEDTATVESTVRLWQLLLEGGYDLGVGDNVVLRPKLEAGIARVTWEVCTVGAIDCPPDTKVKVALAPGGTFLLLTNGFSLTLDVRYELVFFQETLNGLILSAGIGF